MGSAGCREPADLGEWLAQPPLAAVVTARDLAAAKALRALTQLQADAFVTLDRS